MGKKRSDSDDERVIRNLVEDWAGAVRRKDVDGILRHHSREIWMFDVPPPLHSKGIEAYRKTWDLFFPWSRDPVVFEIKEMSITAGRDVAWVAALMRCAGKEAGRSDSELDFRLTIGLRKIDNEWTVMHEHHSVPAAE
jgi:ketosteroid isomerase-like protein